MRIFRLLQGMFLLFLLLAGVSVSVQAAGHPQVRQTGASGKTAALSWERADQAVSYGIYYKYAVQKEYHLLQRVHTAAAEPAVSVSLPKAGRKYQIKIIPYDSQGKAGDAYMPADCVTLPGKISLRSQKSYATSQSMKLYWKDVESAEGYEFLVKDLYGSVVKRYRSDKKSSALLTGIPSGRFYRLRIRGYTRVNGRIVYGTASHTYIAQQPRVKFKWGSHSVVIASWPKVEGAAEYTVYLTDNPARGYRKVKTVKDSEAVVAGLSKNRKYYVYVSAKMRKGKNVYTSPKTKRYTFRLQTE